MNEQILDSIARNKYLVYLDNVGIDIDLIKDEIIKNIDEDEVEQFVNRSHQRLSPNVYLDSLVFKYICKNLHDEYKSSLIFENEIKLDIKTIIATSKSLIQRPRIRKPSDVVIGFKEPDYEDGFRVISRFERELSENNYGERGENKGSVILEGLLPYRIEMNPLVEKYSSNHIWENSYYLGEPFIQGFNTSINSIESQYVLWMNSELLNMFGLRLDNYNNGLRALNSNNEIILQFRYWREQLIGNGASFIGMNSNIAKLEGCDLILRDDYFSELKKIIPNVVFYTDVL
ncbi:hypothetical protein [Photobacterium iliopiscarium]|uniref:hypothetical protein n=1 Tax=Photobacterium iliopiscarium TaxID=56192 RepID=UPI001E2A359D|nr:hypothetical protein [Photobacterium iliopiscarium]MCD9466435.1 hypothetical protein [Photobacterium iliopiscarium]MCD9486199.1 hypothetical protein [Photobacterium iliopiscarium]MCF2243862.1 hypothetical protein [Photobacterium iliopiscarium]